MTSEIAGGIYQHYTDLIVLVLGLARHSETEEKLVAYIPLGVKKGPRITVRPLADFLAEVEVDGKKVPHFQYIGSEMPEELASRYLPLSK